MLTTDADYDFSFRWNVIDNSQTLEGLLSLKSTKLSNPPSQLSWFAIGFGSTMLTTESIMCHSNYTTATSLEQAYLREHVAPRKYGVPGYFPQNVKVGLTDQDGFANKSTALCYFKRKLDLNDGAHNVINIESSDMIWAFHPNPPLNYLGTCNSYHGPNRRGLVSLSLQTGKMMQLSPYSFNNKRTHGLGMMIAWLVLIPLGVFVARYGRSYEGWINIKIAVQSLASLLVITVGIVVVMATNFSNGIHSYFGFIILSFVLIQSTLGVVNVNGMSNENLPISKDRVKLFHQLIGTFLMLFAIVQIGLGIDILYPWVDPREFFFWIFYITAIVVWVAIFLFAEIYLRFSSSKSQAEYQSIPLTEVLRLPESSSGKELKTFTWSNIDSAILNGELLAVANNSYVYDISTWIKSHPGGQVILHAVNGTDITDDYFKSGGFDADLFVPNNIKAKRTNQKQAPRTFDTFHQSTPSNLIPINQRNINDDSLLIAQPLTETDFKAIQRARRTHIHTRKAIERLSQL
ncbi:hypothetical protein BC833DRAFT_639961, partial [Globomyces pollinis-pini]